jgi:hypothetical protein
VKLVAEPARIWLWLVEREQILARRAVLRRALELMPEEEEALRGALALHDDLPRSPEAPLADELPFCLRMSVRLAGLLEAEIADAETTPVRLLWGAGARARAARPGARPLPLADWRAVVVPRGIEETFVVLEGDAADPVFLGDAARSATRTRYPAVRADGLFLFPAIQTDATVLRSIQFAGSDPVSFALAGGSDVARFPRVAGWSAFDTAARAVAEHRGWLESRPAADGSRIAETLVAMLTAARAGLFLEGLCTQEPELPLTLAATVERLGARSPAAADVAESALVGCRAAWSGLGRPSRAVVVALEELVRSLPAYSSPIGTAG